MKAKKCYQVNRKAVLSAKPDFIHGNVVWVFVSTHKKSTAIIDHSFAGAASQFEKKLWSDLAAAIP
jgi:hypothetical protein